MNDVYCSPQKFGLRQIAEMEWDEPNYSFDMSVIWRDGDGRWLVGSDSGCSCPPPFQDQGIGELDRFDSAQAALESLKPRLDKWCGDYGRAQYAQFAETVMRDADAPEETR